ncbi:uncharacterized protein LOC142177999 [Nicotiana tabacum]|uniref:Uncharacterized protein LOC142177999 n=1 Tax=Nicotiana tabacum TaxID=4097 RepID=A0AC58U1Q1_TOBAC
MLVGRTHGFKQKAIGLVSEHCGYKGHLKENCYKIVGYPQDFKIKKKAGQFRGNSGKSNVGAQAGGGFRPYVNNATAEGYMQGHFFTREEYSQLMGLLNKTPPTDCNTNMVAGTVSLLSTTYACEWIIDSGASHHITPCKELLEELRSLEKQHDSRVQVPIGNKSSITSAGSTVILGSQKITNVLHVSDFKFNLLSVSKLTKELLCSVIFPLNSVCFRDFNNVKVMWIGRENNGLYILQRGWKPTVCAAITRNDENGAELWHLRLGHPSVVAMQHIPSLKNKANGIVHEHCSVCPMAKQIRLSFPNSRMLDGKSTYKLLHGKEPKLDHLRVFGCLCYASNLPRGDKLAPRARKAILMGYSETQKGYILFDLYSKTFFVSRDVSFREEIFPFRSMPIEKEEEVLLMPLTDMTRNVKHTQDYNVYEDQPLLVQQATKPVEEVSIGEQIPDYDRGKRVTKRPIWLKDYVTTTSKPTIYSYSIANYVGYVHLSVAYQEYLSLFSTHTEPKTFNKASKDQKWIEAMQQEISALEQNQIWELVDLSKGKQAVGSKWVYKIKYKPNGEADKYKARLVAKGYTQQEGLDYHETFSPVAKMVTVGQ